MHAMSSYAYQGTPIELYSSNLLMQTLSNELELVLV